MNLGKNQVSLLNCLHRHGRYGPWCGWLWDTDSGTKRILESLVKRGLVRKKRHEQHGSEFNYFLTAKGKRIRSQLNSKEK